MYGFGKLEYLLRKEPGSRNCAREAVVVAPRMLALLDEQRELLLDALQILEGQDNFLCEEIRLLLDSHPSYV